MRSRTVLLSSVLLVLLALAPALAQAASAPSFSQGNVTLSDGTQLHYSVRLPAGGGPAPTVMVYDPYAAPGMVPLEDFSWLVNQGYAVVGVDLPGVACSTGAKSILDAAAFGQAGAQAIEWIAHQPWSNGHVGMVGSSFPGLDQLAVAGHRPPHLDAIAPFNPLGDFYRDILYPGGIYNTSWTTEYAALVQPGVEAASLAEGLATDPSGCPGATVQQVLQNQIQDVALQAPQHPYIDNFWANEPDSQISNITIPVLGCVGWQDGAVGSSAAELFLEDLPPATTWMIGNNAGHAVCVDSRALLTAFLARYVKGVHNGFEKTPHIILRHQISSTTALLDLGGLVTTGFSPLEDEVPDPGSWNSTLPSAAVIQPTTLHLGAGGTLGSTPPAAVQAPDSYIYPLPSSSNNPAPVQAINTISGWQIPDAPDGYETYTTAALTANTEFLGPGSANLWVSSTGDDADLQVTLSAVLPDGLEQYVQRGWLRLSQRGLDPSMSTSLFPFHTDTQQAASLLTPGVPVLARVEIQPFDYLFPRGSSIRLTIDAPSDVTGGDALEIIPTLAVNSIYHSAAMDSQLVLGLVPASTPQGPQCDETAMEPCRVNLAPVPAGSLTVAPDPAS